MSAEGIAQRLTGGRNHRKSQVEEISDEPQEISDGLQEISGELQEISASHSRRESCVSETQICIPRRRRPREARRRLGCKGRGIVRSIMDTFHLVTQIDISIVLFLLLIECQER